MDDYRTRQTVKTFGTLVDDRFHADRRALFPDNGFANRFTGYHAGVDVEFGDVPGPVSVRAVAAGRVVYVGRVAGYGGLVIIRHDQPEVITSLYGHVRDVAVRVGDPVAEGQPIALLGEAFTPETSGARKHLHFGIHRGPATAFAGHEPDRARLAGWYNPNDWLARRAERPQLATAATVTPPPPAPAGAPAPEPESWLDRLIDFIRSWFD